MGKKNKKIIYKRCKTCGSIYPADMFERGKTEFEVEILAISKCPYCKDNKFEKVEINVMEVK